ncbi:hypothetical protein ACQ4PT_062590 [Festuca glaucescens]
MIQEAVTAALAAATQKQTGEGQQLTQVVQQANTTQQPAVPQANAQATAALVVVASEINPQAKKANKIEKQSCFRCKQPGHLIDDCSVPVCDICESIHHITSACHLLQAPKPTVTMYGYANEGLMFCECPTTGTFQPKVDNAKLAKVTIEGDTLTIPELVELLKRIVPSENFQWEVQHYHNNVFKVKFPNKAEVQRAKNFHMYKVPDRDTDIHFDVWASVEEPLYLLPEVWVQIAGVPSDVRADFLALWGLGTLLGKTKEVDMAFTRKKKIVRLLIGCVNHNFISDTMDMFIKRGFYKLDFMVEPLVLAQDATKVEAQDGIDGDKDDQGDQGDLNGDGKGGADMDMDDTSTKHTDDATNVSHINPALAGGWVGNSNSGHVNMKVVSPIKVGQIVCSPVRLGMDKQEISLMIPRNSSNIVENVLLQNSEVIRENLVVYDASGNKLVRFAENVLGAGFENDLVSGTELINAELITLGSIPDAPPTASVLSASDAGATNDETVTPRCRR